MVENSPVVLIVDDEPDVADAYAGLLGDAYECRVAYGGSSALDMYGPDIDVVLLDRRMPDLSGDEVLEAIRDREGTARVAMVTAVDPDFDVIEMGFDEYIVKPVSGDELAATVERLLGRSAYEEDVLEYFSLVTKRATLEAEKPREVLVGNERYQSLRSDIQRMESRLEETIDDLTLEDYADAFRDLQDDESR